MPKILVTYDSDHLRGELACPFCGKSYELAGNVRTYRDEKGVDRTYPDAKLKVYSHFHYDHNAHIPECPAIRKVQHATWEAVEQETGRVVARGRVEVPIDEHSVGPITVTQDDPPI